MATGLLWAPCAGPILGLVLTGAAISGPNARTSLLLFAYAAGAATSLGVAILAGGRAFAFLKKSLGAGEWLRRALGIAVLLAVVAIVCGWDSSILARVSLAGTNRLEQSLIGAISPSGAAQTRTGCRPQAWRRLPARREERRRPQQQRRARRGRRPTWRPCPSRAKCRRSAAPSRG